MRRETCDKARALRRQGMSVRRIAEIIGASKGSVSVWVRDIQLSESQQAALKQNQRQWGAHNKGAQTNRDKHLRRRQVFQAEGREKAQDSHPLHMMGCMLYWAEGAKLKNRIHFVNSDPNMMILFIRFLREQLEVGEDEFVIYIHCHTHDVNEQLRIESYWLNLLNLPLSSLRTTYVKKGSDTRRNILENGVCTICVHRTDLVMHIFGAIQEYGGFENEQWLF